MRGRFAQQLGKVFLALALVGVPLRGLAQDEATAAPRIYRWIDENGIAHYTADPKQIPRALRSQVGKLGALGELPPRSLERPDLQAHAPEPATSVPRAASTHLPLPSSRASTGSLPPLHAERPPDAWAALDRPAENSPPVQGEASLQSQRDDLDLRIAALRDDIAADEETIKKSLSEGMHPAPLAKGGDSAFREVARRLPKRLAELRELRDQRAKLESK